MPETFEEWLSGRLNENPLMSENSINHARSAWDAASVHTKIHDDPKEHCRHVWLKYDGLGSHETIDLRKQACADDGCYGMWCQAEMKADQLTRRIGNRPPDRPKIVGKGYATG